MHIKWNGPYLDLSSDKLKLLSSNLELPRMAIKTRKNSTAKKNSTVWSRIAFANRIVSKFSNVGRKNMLFQWTKNPRPSLYNISAKNHLNWLQNLSFENLFLRIFSTIFGFSSIFDQLLLLTIKRYVFDHSNFPNIMSPGITAKTSRKNRLRNCLNVIPTKFDVRDFWKCSKINRKEIS